MPMIGTIPDTSGSALLASSGLGATLGQAIAFAMLRVGGMPYTSSQILGGQWDGTSLAGSLAMLDEAVDSGRWGETHLRAFLDALDLTDFIKGSATNQAALADGLVHDPLLAALANAGLTTAFFAGDRLSVAGLTAAATSLTAILMAPENHAPTLSPAAPAGVVLAEGSALVLHLADFFQDADDDALSFTVATDAGDVPWTLTAEGDLVLRPGFASSGLHGLTITASDGEASVSHAMQVDVTEAGAATRLMSSDFTRLFGAAETLADALAVTPKSRGIDILDQTAVGDAPHLVGVDNLTLRAGADVSATLILTEAVRVLTLRGAADFTVVGRAGNNVIYGGSGVENITGEGGIDQIYGNDGDDWLSGGADADKLWGGNGADTLTGDAGDDQLFGGEGADYLRGGTGRDQATGGAGADVFDFWQGDGTFILRDMTAGQDVIRMAFAGMTSLDDLRAQAVMQDVDGLLRITLGSDQLQISGMSSAQLTEDMFLFA